MLIRVLSDLHLEFGPYQVQSMPEDKDTILVLAGDITVAASKVSRNLFAPFMKTCSEQFKEVVMVMGNHEHYHGKFENTANILNMYVKDLPNVHILDNSSMVFEDTWFIGSTLWTDCGGLHDANPNAFYLWHGMTDSKIIKYHSGPFTVDSARQEYLTSRDYIFKSIKRAKSLNLKVVVVVHHLVSDKSIHPIYAGQEFNMFFKSDMDLDFAEADPDLIIHGHTHHALDYMLDETICKTRVVCNPRGYHGHETAPKTRGFNPQLRIDL